MKNNEFLESVQEYFGGFENEYVSKFVIQEVKRYDNEDRKEIFQYLIENFHARYKVDLKMIKQAVSITGAKAKCFCDKCGREINSGICYDCEKKEIEKDMASEEDLKEFREMMKNIGYKAQVL